MTIYINEMRRAFKSLCIWICSVAFMVVICIFMFPEMENEMDSVSAVFANMGGFTKAFGMDKLSFGELMGFYGIECGNILGIGGGFFAALAGISALSCEEREHTAEFLLTHPVSRVSVTAQKLLSVITQVIVLNIVTAAASVISAEIIGEHILNREFALMHIAYLIMQLEIACICFGISAFLRRGGIGLGLGLALALYFMNIVCNISEKAEFLKYVTPYAYSDSGRIISESQLDALPIILGAVYSVIFIITAFVKYGRKDIAA